MRITSLTLLALFASLALNNVDASTSLRAGIRSLEDDAAAPAASTSVEGGAAAPAEGDSAKAEGDAAAPAEDKDPIFGMNKLAENALIEAKNQRLAAVKVTTQQLEAANEEAAAAAKAATEGTGAEGDAEGAAASAEGAAASAEGAAAAPAAEAAPAADAAPAVDAPVFAAIEASVTDECNPSVEDCEEFFVDENGHEVTAEGFPVNEGIPQGENLENVDTYSNAAFSAVDSSVSGIDDNEALGSVETVPDTVGTVTVAAEDGAPAAGDTAGEGADAEKNTPAKEPEMRDRADFNEEIDNTKRFLEPHSFTEDVGKLLESNDGTEDEIKAMKLKIVEKENFIDGIMKKENLLQADLGADKAVVADLESHMKSVNARVERIKKEKQLRLLEAQFHEYAAASSKLKGQAEDLTTVKDALYSKMKFLNDMITPLVEKEKTNMREALNTDGAVKAPDTLAKGDAGAAGAAAPAAAPAAPAF